MKMYQFEMHLSKLNVGLKVVKLPVTPVTMLDGLPTPALFLERTVRL